MRNRIDFENDPLILNAIQRNLIEIHGDRITYNIHQKKTYNWADPEEWVRARTIAFLVLKKAYTPRSIRTEVVVPRRTPEDFADIVVYTDERCQNPYLVIENKKEQLSHPQENEIKRLSSCLAMQIRLEPLLHCLIVLVNLYFLM